MINFCIWINMQFNSIPLFQAQQWNTEDFRYILQWVDPRLLTSPESCFTLPAWRTSQVFQFPFEEQGWMSERRQMRIHLAVLWEPSTASETRL